MSANKSSSIYCASGITCVVLLVLDSKFFSLMFLLTDGILGMTDDLAGTENKMTLCGYIFVAINKQY